MNENEDKEVARAWISHELVKEYQSMLYDGYTSKNGCAFIKKVEHRIVPGGVFGESLLYMAVCKRRLDAVMHLLEKGVRPNCGTFYPLRDDIHPVHGTADPLIFVASRFPQMLKLLLDHGADPNYVYDGQPHIYLDSICVLQYAYEHTYFDSCRILIEHHAVLPPFDESTNRPHELSQFQEFEREINVIKDGRDSCWRASLAMKSLCGIKQLDFVPKDIFYLLASYVWKTRLSHALNWEFMLNENDGDDNAKGRLNRLKRMRC